jgi:hypothetical protein
MRCPVNTYAATHKCCKKGTSCSSLYNILFFDSLSCSFFIQSEGHEVTTHQIDYKTREGIIPNDSNVRVPSEA